MQRSLSWKKLLGLHQQEFLTWLDENEQRLKIFNKLAGDLERCIKMCLTPCPYEHGVSTVDLCNQFIDCIPSMFNKLNNQEIYEGDIAVLAYAHIHLLARYRKIWDVLLRLLDAAVLPMNEKGLEVLDVGTGPATALYAIFDFYQTLQNFANEKGYTSLITPLPNLYSVESSPYMEHFTHLFSEISQRTRGPYFVTFDQFKGLDFTKLRANARNKIRQGEEYYDYTTESWETWYEEASNLGWTEGLFRYHLVVFGNILTEKDKVEEWRQELLSAFLAVRHGGLVVVIGSSDDSYKPIYNNVIDVAKEAALGRVKEVEGNIPPPYSDQYKDTYAQRTKEHNNIVWRWIKENSGITNDYLKSKSIAKHLYMPEKKLKDKGYNLLVFRRNEQPWKRKR